MKTYRFDTLNFTGSSTDLVKLLHKGSRAQAKDDATWMMEAAGRFRLMTGIPIRYDTSDNFIDDLIQHDMLNVLTGN
jgi:hypothetical protein